MRAKVPCWGENWSRLCPCLGGGGGGCHSPLLDWHQPHQRPVGGHSILFWECFISRNCLRYGTAADVFTVNVYSKNYWTDRAFPDMIVPSDFWSVCLCLCLMRGGGRRSMPNSAHANRCNNMGTQTGTCYGMTRRGNYALAAKLKIFAALLFFLQSLCSGLQSFFWLLCFAEGKKTLLE